MLLARKVENLLAESDEYAATYFTEHSTKMNFQLQPGVKFACVAFEDVAIDHSRKIAFGCPARKGGEEKGLLPEAAPIL